MTWQPLRCRVNPDLVTNALEQFPQLECACIRMHVRMCDIMILIHEPLTTYSTKKLEILFVMVNMQFIVINACKFLVAVGFSTRYFWYDIFILKAKFINKSQQLFPLTLC